MFLKILFVIYYAIACSFRWPLGVYLYSCTLKRSDSLTCTLQINLLLEWTCTVYGVINYGDMGGIRTSIKNSKSMIGSFILIKLITCIISNNSLPNRERGAEGSLFPSSSVLGYFTFPTELALFIGCLFTRVRIYCTVTFPFRILASLCCKLPFW